MSGADDGMADPKKPWQMFFIIFFVILAMLVIYLFIHVNWFSNKKPPPLERSDNGSYQPLISPPAEIVPVVAKMTPHTASQQTPQSQVDETNDWKSPIIAGGTPAAAAPHPTEAPHRPEPDPEDAHRGGDSIFGAKAVAYRIRHPEWTIRKGKVIPCADQTAIDTNAGGNVGVTATISQDVWSMDRSNILLPKGTMISGELAHGMVNGLDRIAVIWREATTPSPDDVGVTLDSPATGPLGEGGLDGDVNRHEWQKIKGVVALSLLQGLLNVAQARAQQSGTTNISTGFQPIYSGSGEAAAIMLQSQINIPDTFHRDHGLACAIYMAKDLDFSKVYENRVIR
jgi:type IV secretion system protein VirB10